MSEALSNVPHAPDSERVTAQLTILARQLSEAEDFAAALANAALYVQTDVDSGLLDADEVMEVVCDAGALRGLNRPAVAHDFTAAIKAVRKIRHWSDSPPSVKAASKESTQQELEPNEWFAPIPFAEYQLPTFPTDAFPEWLRNFVMALAHATQTLEDVAASIALSVLAACAARRYRISLGKWCEPLNLFLVAVLAPGNRKSAVHEELTRPLIAYEQNLIELERERIAKERTEYKILEARLERLQKEAAKEKDKAKAVRLRTEAEDVATEFAGKTYPVDPQLICDDVTPETLATLLAEQGSRIAMFSSEGGCFEVMAGRYSKGLNLEVYLKGHAGDDLRINRRGRSEYVQRPALTIGITVQPEVMRGLAKNEAFRGKGLLGRWLYSWPLSLIGRREVDPDGVPADVATVYARNIHKLAELQPESSEKERVIELAPSARETLREYARKLEPEMREGGSLGEFTDWAAKLVGAVGRIAGLLHLATHSDERMPPTQVSLETVQAACRIGDYYTAHARVAFSEMGASSVVEDARYILRWLRRELPYRSEQQKLIYTKREIHRGCQARFKTVDEIEPALSLLIAHEYFKEIERPATEPKRTAGRRPSARFQLNPFFLPSREIDTIDKTPTDQPESSHSVNSVNLSEERKKEVFRPGNSLAEQLAALSDDDLESEQTKLSVFPRRLDGQSGQQREVVTI